MAGGAMRKWRSSWLLGAAVAIPLGQQGDWQVLKYRSIQPNRIEFTESGMKIEVQHSASPLIYPLKTPLMVSKLLVAGKIEGALQIPSKRKQGEKHADDFTVRVGLVLAGDKKLSKWQAMVAPDWIKRLHSLAPKDGGVDHIEFFNVVQDRSLIGNSRRHPKSELLVENFVIQPEADGTFKMETEIRLKQRVVALWLSSDGDDTASKYSVTINSLRLETSPP